jgi:hypothetical protein
MIDSEHLLCEMFIKRQDGHFDVRDKNRIYAEGLRSPNGEPLILLFYFNPVKKSS